MVLVYKTHSDVNHLLFQFLCDRDNLQFLAVESCDHLKSQ
jgi:hypothetical protein